MEKQIRRIINTTAVGVYALCTLRADDVDFAARVDAMNKAMAADYSPSIVKKYTDSKWCTQPEHRRTIFYLFNMHELTSRNETTYWRSIANEAAKHAEYFNFQFDECYTRGITNHERQLMKVVKLFSGSRGHEIIQLSVKIDQQLDGTLAKRIVGKVTTKKSLYCMWPQCVYLSSTLGRSPALCLTISILSACKQIVYEKHCAGTRPTYDDVCQLVHEFVKTRTETVLHDLGSIPDIGGAAIMRALVAFVLADYV